MFRSRLSVQSMSCLLLGLSPVILAADEAVLDPNQITGVIEFSNQYLAEPNPEVAQFLQSFYFSGNSYLNAMGENHRLTAQKYLAANADIPYQLPYSLTVSTNEFGERYDAYVRARFADVTYYFDRHLSDPVFPEPASDVIQNHQECAAVIDVSYVDANGMPSEVTGLVIAERELPRYDGSVYYSRKSQTTLQNGISGLQLPVRGDNSTYRIRSSYTSGSDISTDRITYECHHNVTPACDTVVPLTCQIANGGGLGQIKGIFEIEGETPRPNRSLVSAWGGPFDNSRTLHSTNPGAFVLPNIVPSNAVDPGEGYSLNTFAEYRTGNAVHRYHSPYRYYNQIMVDAGQVSDVAANYVIKPSYVRGAINLFGPSNNVSGLSRLREAADTDTNGDGYPNSYYYSNVQAFGSNKYGAGASYTSVGGWAYSAFDVTGDENNLYSGNYELAVGGLNGENSIWSPAKLVLSFDHFDPALEGLTPMVVGITNKNHQNKELVPGQAMEQLNHEYCFSDLTLNYRSTNGKFYRPYAYMYGSFNGTDFINKAADYSVSGNQAYGLPATPAEASNTGHVKFTLPQGNYTIRPSVLALNGSSSANSAQLPELQLEVGCAQKIDISTGLQLQFSQPLPQQTSDELLTITGDLNSNGSTVSVSINVNDSGEQEVCSECGDSFTTTVSLQEGVNEIVVWASDDTGNTASVSSNVIYKINKLNLSCSNVEVTIDALTDRAKVDYSLQTNGNCEMPATVSCSPASGSLFDVGTTAVNCSAQNSCGAEASCQFNVKVEQLPLPKPDDNCDGSVVSIEQQVDVNSLWPANHKMVDIGFSRSAQDDCENEVNQQALYTEVWSNEPEIFMVATGGGNTSPDATDMQGELKLRAERFGTGNGRIYLLISGDVNGNVFDCKAVTVPHDQSKAAKAFVSGQAKAAVDYCNEHEGSAIAGYFKHGMFYPEQESQGNNGNDNGNGNGGAGNGNGNGNNNDEQGEGDQEPGNGNGGNGKGGGKGR